MVGCGARHQVITDHTFVDPAYRGQKLAEKLSVYWSRTSKT